MSGFIDINEEKVNDVEWLSGQLGYRISNVAYDDMSSAGGLNAQMRRMRVTRAEDNIEKTYVLKNVRPTEHGLTQSKQLGLAREAVFYRELSSGYSDLLPDVLFSYGDMSTGNKFILLEDMSDAVQAGYFFGPSSPHNWNRDLQSLMDRAPKLLSAAAEKSDSDKAATSGSNFDAMIIVAQASFLLAARIQGSNWCNRSLLDKPWLRGSDWLKGEGQASWEGSQDMARNFWKKTKEDKMQSEAYNVKWSEYMVSLMDSSLAKINWTNYQTRVKREPWTLAHGDFHPANMMWRAPKASNTCLSPTAEATKSRADTITTQNSEHPIHELRRTGRGVGSVKVSSGEAGSIVLLDWENVGIGSGPQDLGQYVISHMAPADRRLCEMQLLRLYYHELCSYIKASSSDSTTILNYSWDDCLSEYVRGGVERWVWLLALLSAMCPDPMVQFFHDQVEAFARDHKVTTETIDMPRL